MILSDGVEVWLQSLSESAAKTIREMNIQIIQDCNTGVVMDEWPSKVNLSHHNEWVLMKNTGYFAQISAKNTETSKQDNSEISESKDTVKTWDNAHTQCRLQNKN